MDITESVLLLVQSASGQILILLHVSQIVHQPLILSKIIQQVLEFVCQCVLHQIFLDKQQTILALKHVLPEHMGRDLIQAITYCKDVFQNVIHLDGD